MAQVRRVRQDVRAEAAACGPTGDLRRVALLEAGGPHAREPAPRVPRGERASSSRVVRGEPREAQGQRGAAGRWFVTPHAIDRWIERFTPRSFREAPLTEAMRARVLGWIIDETERARFVKRLASGVELWRGPKPRRIRFLVGASSDGALPALLTVMPACDGWMRPC